MSSGLVCPEAGPLGVFTWPNLCVCVPICSSCEDSCHTPLAKHDRVSTLKPIVTHSTV